MIELTENMTDDEIRAGLIERADEAIDTSRRVDGLGKEIQEAQRELEKALDEVATWLDLSDESLMSLSRGGYFIGWVEEETKGWLMTIRRETPADHIDLD